ncbi:response regulator [Cohnella caldifontis]|uniref:response regulator n=1 Tax=Cohnella caldifontis TaxID=3027471 RepID=UPI0023EACCEE|nr:response regulator [Cohnella sp. YIM B05605]
MWNLLAVEDEPIVRVGLRFMVDWERYGVVWKAEANGAEEALRILSREDIHIVLTDIRMPGMDGLELAKRIKAHNPGVQVIFVSSYDEFQYAKEAIRIGAVDYLHKATMDEEEIAGALGKAVDMLRQTAEAKQQMTQEQRNEYLLSLLDACTYPESPLLPELRDETYASGFRLVVFRKRDDAVLHDGESEQLRFLSTQYFIDEYVSKDWGGIVFQRQLREVIWISPLTPRSGDVPSDFTRYLDQLRHKVLELLSVALLYSSSPSYADMEQLPEAYLQALLRSPLYEQCDHPIVRQAKAYVDLHLVEDISLAKVAQAIHVSPGHLSRVFYREVGENFSEYIIRNKMELAQKRLRETNRKVYEIAADIGYANPHYFSKLFKERTGVTPLEYRSR